MIRKKVVTEHWHAFRDRKGLFAKCQLILRLGIDAFSPESMHLVDMAKDDQHPLDEPSQMDGPDNAQSRSNKVRARGRRLLAKEVAILDAPVYAAQVAAKRAAEAASGSPHRPKRAKYSAQQKRGDGDGPVMPPESQASKGIRFAVSGLGKRHAGTGLGDPADALPYIQPVTTIRFLEPNTYLQDESPPFELEETPMPIDPQLRQAEEQEPDPQPQSPTPIRPDAYVFGDIKPIFGFCGSWPELDSHDFDRPGISFTLSGWIPDRKWLRWAGFGHEIEKRFAAREARLSSSALTKGPYQRFLNRLRACVEVEASWKPDFANAVPGEAGPHNIFVSSLGEDGEDAFRLPLNLVWPAEEQLTLTSTHDMVSKFEGEVVSSSDEESSQDPFAETKAPRLGRRGIKFATVMGVKPPRIKRVALVTRALTALPAQSESTGDAAEVIEDSAELMAAFIAVRSLLGGAEKAIDWGLLVRIFPSLGLTYLRKFWADARKEQAAYISNFTRVFQERLIAALDEEELPMIDFEKPLAYDWGNLIQWTVQLPRQEGFQLPQSRDSLTKQYSLDDVKATGEDWREKYFHVLSSFFARYEAVSSEPGVVAMGEASRGFHEPPRIDELVIARSWIKSLCSTAETRYSAEQVRSKFLQLAARDKQRRSELLKEAAAQLAQQRVICRKERPLARGRPYRLNEWYLSTLAKMAQSSKYDEAAAFKEELDSTFRRKETMRVPYTLNDGAMMALTNLSAAGRIRLVPVDVPNIPFGFEPGSYESRKTPKSYYHFALEAVPTATYEYNEEIKVLRDVVREGPPRGGPQGESPQWIDIFGQSNVQRWSELLGAFCFTFATRGSMTIEGICSALSPLLDEFEAYLIVAWGTRTGVLTDLVDNVGTTVGDWWWLAVPWSRHQTGDQAEKMAQ
ncbi:TFIIIC transcription initiation factor complex subunits Tfc3 [Hirsutella rhossiliensis]|uniref:TFIIIC transcription initiation factor complex subunits Tfc3 n=1 Tax=Hirsutella rhossiliensis TaxID=111463 RepID=A0A9P8N2Q7_9HYPO|nr:TFIIIC transcription initiation factor complex subunits Tfc3 [Hirsutella rhossiliensis]KAH0964871.1 TFIIIC transcription initiation factor complex subunits Tfc3 [Hirsutella rhossiliensis]